MINDSIENSAPATEAEQKPKRKHAKKAKDTKKSTPAKRAAGKPKGDRANKKAEVTALMKRAKGTTLAEIMKATGWQAHTVQGFVSILGSKGGEKIESSKSTAGSGRTRSQSSACCSQAPLPVPAGAAFPASVGRIAKQVT